MKSFAVLFIICPLVLKRKTSRKFNFIIKEWIWQDFPYDPFWKSVFPRSSNGDRINSTFHIAIFLSSEIGCSLARMARPYQKPEMHLSKSLWNKIWISWCQSKVKLLKLKHFFDETQVNYFSCTWHTCNASFLKKNPWFFGAAFCIKNVLWGERKYGLVLLYS